MPGSGKPITPWDPIRALRVLADHGVRFVLIGGYGARLLGSNSVTNDTDICYARDPENLERLAMALRALDARLRGRDIPDDLPFELDARTLAAGDCFTFQTDAGALDILGTPSGSGSGFDQLIANAVEQSVEGIPVKVASIDDLIRMKLAAHRPKDLVEVEILGALRDEIDRRAIEGRKRRG